MSERIVFDTSTLVGAVLRPESVPDLALRKALQFSEVCVSVETLAELEMVLDRAKFDRYTERQRRHIFMESFRSDCFLFAVADPDPASLDPPCRDPRDTKFLALALAAHADAIVSSDEDLLILHPWRGIPILTPAQFLSK